MNEIAIADGTSGGYTETYADLAGNRTERRVEVKNVSGTSTLTTQYAYYTGSDRLQTETYVNNLPFAALPWGQDRMYAYAGPEGNLSFGVPGSQERIGPFGAFWKGLPSVWNRVALILLAAFGPILAQQWRRIRGMVTDGPRPTLSVYHRCLCVLFAYIFLVGPENFQSLASAEIQYSALSTATWGQSGQTIEYGYDANGAQNRKTTKVTSNQQVVEELRYDYTLRGNLQRVVDTNKTWDTLTDDKMVAEYRYNPSGIRVGKTEYVNGVATTRTDYLIDPYNPTGYAQVLEERTVASGAPTTQNRIHYTLGDDVISQAKSVWTLNGSEWVLQTAYDTEYLLYDGHGSTRQLTRPDKSIIDNYSYDGYGIMLGDATTPNPAQTAATKYLYAGEQYDKSLSHYYLRARYYNPSNGRFNQTDPFAGNPSDPQSLHKYLYAHCNPVNMNDPTGLMGDFSIVSLASFMAIWVILSTNSANAPRIGDKEGIRDTTGDIIVDIFVCIGAVTVFSVAGYAIGKIFRLPRRVRLPQDINIDPVPPPARSLNRPIGSSPTQNARLQRDIQRLRQEGCTDFRVHQHQVNAEGQRVGKNLPDLQYTSPYPQQRRMYHEYERSNSPRGPGHKERILANDPDGIVIIIIQD